LKNSKTTDEQIKKSGMKDIQLNTRFQALLSLTIITPLGFLCKFYRGPGFIWFNDYGGGIFYELFWCFAFFLIWPRKSATLRICGGVFIGTTILEFLQLFSHPTLDYIRSGFIGRTLIGSSFSLLDIPHYLIGCVLALGWLRAISRE